MIVLHPNPVGRWDTIPEKLIQAAIHKCLPATWIREYPIGNGYLDLLSPDFAIEIKRSTSGYPAYQTVGQIQYYTEALRLSGFDRLPVILLYGTEFDKYLDPVITSMRQRSGIRLWLIVSIANPEIIDLDTGLSVPIV